MANATKNAASPAVLSFAYYVQVYRRIVVTAMYDADCKPNIYLDRIQRPMFDAERM